MPKRKTLSKSRKRKSKRKSRKSKRKSKRKSRKSKRKSKRKSRKSKRKSRKSKRKSRKSKRKSRKSKRKSRKSKRKSRKSKPRKSRKSKPLESPPKKGLKGIRLKKGELEGYKLSDSVIERRRTLGIQVYEKGYLPVMKRVNVISILLRNKSPQLSKNAESDKKWLMKRQKEGGSEARWVPRRIDGNSFYK